MFFWKSWKFNLDFKNAKKKKRWEENFRFWDHCISIGCNNMFLLKREYLSSSGNVLTNSLKILHITKRDFFQLNYFHSDQ